MDELKVVLDEYREFVHSNAFSPLVQRALHNMKKMLLAAKVVMKK